MMQSMLWGERRWVGRNCFKHSRNCFKHSINFCNPHSGFFALLGWIFKPDDCTMDHAWKQLPPKCTNILVKYLKSFANWYVLQTNLWDANIPFTYFPEMSMCYSRNWVSSLLLSLGLFCLEWLLLHSAAGPLGLRKKFHMEFLLKRIPLLIPWCCPVLTWNSGEERRKSLRRTNKKRIEPVCS